MGMNEEKTEKHIFRKITIPTLIAIFILTYGYLAVTINEFQIFILALNVVSLLILMYVSNRILEDKLEEAWQDDVKNIMYQVQLQKDYEKIKKRYYSLLSKMRWLKEGEKNVRKRKGK